MQASKPHKIQVTAEEAPDHDFGAKNANGDTILHVAARAGDISTLMRSLHALSLPYSENPNEAVSKFLVKNKQGNTFFHEALLYGHKDIIMGLLLGCEEQQFEAKGLKGLHQPLTWFTINKEKKNILHLAIEEGYKDIVEQALTKLINPVSSSNSSVPSGKPPLHEQDQACCLRHQEMTKNNLEMQLMIPYDTSGVQPAQPLAITAILKQDIDILDIILTKKKEWIHSRDKQGRTCLHYAASMGYDEGVKYLLKICSYCCMDRDHNGCVPLHFAAAGGHYEIVKKLLEHCPDTRKVLDNHGRNIAHIAAEMGHYNVIRYILKNNDLVKMINDKDAYGNTPLHLATLRSCPKIVYALTRDTHVVCQQVNRKNQTALDVYRQIKQENPPLRQRLTNIALKSAGVQWSEKGSYSIKDVPIPLKSTESDPNEKAPNMDLYKDRINTLLLVSTLITTVSFAGGFTLPGGTNSSDPEKGMALMLHRMWFKLFIFCITISMYGAISVTIILLWAQLGDIILVLLAIKVAMPLLGVTLATLSVAFLAGVHLVITDLNWLATTLLVMCVIFILMLLLLYGLLWFPSSSSLPVIRHISYYPFMFLIWFAERYETKGR